MLGPHQTYRTTWRCARGRRVEPLYGKPLPRPDDDGSLSQFHPSGGDQLLGVIAHAEGQRAADRGDANLAAAARDWIWAVRRRQARIEDRDRGLAQVGARSTCFSIDRFAGAAHSVLTSDDTDEGTSAATRQESRAEATQLEASSDPPDPLSGHSAAGAPVHAAQAPPLVAA